MSSLKRVTDFLGLRKSMVGLLGMVVLVGMGEKMAERFLPIYLLALGGGALTISLLSGLDDLLSALYSFPGGYLSDRIGRKRALLVFNLMAMTGYTIVMLVPTWQAVILGAVLFLSWTAISLPATMSLVAKVLPQDKRTMGVSMHSLVRRIPMALGPIVGGTLIGLWGERTGMRIAFGAALLMAGIGLVMQQILIEEDRKGPGGKPDTVPEKNLFRVLGRMSPGLRHLLVSDILVRFCERIPYGFVVVWSMKVITKSVTGLQFGYLTAIEMVTAMLVYIPVAYLAGRTRKKPFVAMTFGFFTLFPLALWFSRSFVWLVGAFILRGLKEFGEPTRKALIMDLAPEHQEAATFGAYYLVRDVIVSVAAFGGGALWLISPATNFLVAFGFGVLGTLWFAVFGHDLQSAPAA
jgi:MFS family permease